MNIPKVGYAATYTGTLYMPRFGFYDTNLAQTFKPETTSSLLLFGRGFERSLNRGINR